MPEDSNKGRMTERKVIGARHDQKSGNQRLLASLSSFLSRQWEVVFFLAAFALLSLQVSFFNADVQSLSAVHGAIALFASIDSFIMERLSYVTTPAFLLPLLIR
ncbi:hypothetical protein NZK32_17750 [Cyanobium sp. FGCU-52]|nr:hypothetical protein [Cyanobium sp. FGCU52]